MDNIFGKGEIGKDTQLKGLIHESRNMLVQVEKMGQTLVDIISEHPTTKIIYSQLHTISSKTHHSLVDLRFLLELGIIPELSVPTVETHTPTDNKLDDETRETLKTEDHVWTMAKSNPELLLLYKRE